MKSNCIKIVINYYQVASNMFGVPNGSFNLVIQINSIYFLFELVSVEV